MFQSFSGAVLRSWSFLSLYETFTPEVSRDLCCAPEVSLDLCCAHARSVQTALHRHSCCCCELEHAIMERNILNPHLFTRSDYFDFLYQVNLLSRTSSVQSEGAIYIRPSSSSISPLTYSVKERLSQEYSKVTVTNYELYPVNPRKRISRARMKGIYEVRWRTREEQAVNEYYPSTINSSVSVSEDYDLLSSFWGQISRCSGQQPYNWHYAADNPDLYSDAIMGYPIQKLINETITPFVSETGRTEGIDSPFTYYGSPGSTGPMHVEDMDLCSVNILLAGQTKHWIIVSAKESTKVRQLMASTNSRLFQEHPNHYRCKTLILTPEALERAEIPYHEIFQREGEYVVTLPGAFHQVINLGWNCAVAANFAVQDWVRYAVSNGYCYCRQAVGTNGDGLPRWNLQNGINLWLTCPELSQCHQSIFKSRLRCELCLYETEHNGHYERHMKSHEGRPGVACSCGLIYPVRIPKKHLKSGHWRPGPS